MKKFSLFLIVFLISSQAFAFNGRKTVTAAGTAEALSATENVFNQCSICAETDNTGVISVGDQGVIASLSTRTGIPLDASDCYTIAFSGNGGADIRSVYIDSTVSGDGVTYQCFYKN
jgi:uncharacterized protein (UPF0333 family)